MHVFGSLKNETLKKERKDYKNTQLHNNILCWKNHYSSTDSNNTHSLKETLLDIYNDIMSSILKRYSNNALNISASC